MIQSPEVQFASRLPLVSGIGAEDSPRSGGASAVEVVDGSSSESALSESARKGLPVCGHRTHVSLRPVPQRALPHRSNGPNLAALRTLQVVVTAARHCWGGIGSRGHGKRAEPSRSSKYSM